MIGGHAPGHEQWSTVVTVPSEHGHFSVDVPKFKNVARLVMREDVSGEEDGDGSVGGRRDPSRLTGKRKGALGVGAFGAVAVGAATVLGVQAKNAQDEAHGPCPRSPCVDADEANQLGDRAESRARLANVSLSFAVVAVARLRRDPIRLGAAPIDGTC